MFSPRSLACHLPNRGYRLGTGSALPVQKRRSGMTSVGETTTSWPAPKLRSGIPALLAGTGSVTGTTNETQKESRDFIAFDARSLCWISHHGLLVDLVPCLAAARVVIFR